MSPAISFHPVPTEVAGRDMVLVCGFSGVMISITSINRHIGHKSSAGDLFCDKIMNISHRQAPFCPLFRPFLARWQVNRDSFLVLVFAATQSEMALWSVLFDSENKMSKLSMYKSK